VLDGDPSDALQARFDAMGAERIETVTHIRPASTGVVTRCEPCRFEDDTLAPDAIAPAPARSRNTGTSAWPRLVGRGRVVRGDQPSVRDSDDLTPFGCRSVLATL
jgi:hypothetical protein